MSGVHARDVRVRFGAGEVLRGVSLDLAAGQVTAVVGPNGAGKSTLLEALTGLRRPQAGEVALGAVPVLDLPARERARTIAFLPQTPEIAWAVDVETFVGLGRTARMGPWGLGADDRRIVSETLAATGLEAFRRRAITTLSGGERARALVARALAGEPDWLFADEPLAGLDPAHALDTMALFRRLADAGRGVVLTLHDLSVAARTADRVVVLAAGRIVADGAPADCLTPAILAAAYGIEARVTQGAAGPLIEVVGRAG